jgi:hypothetical protein
MMPHRDGQDKQSQRRSRGTPAAGGGRAGVPRRPSQAEGDREAIEHDLREKGLGDEAAPEGQGSGHTGPMPKDYPSKPSQAEGNRETTEEDLQGTE